MLGPSGRGTSHAETPFGLCMLTGIACASSHREVCSRKLKSGPEAELPPASASGLQPSIVPRNTSRGVVYHIFELYFMVRWRLSRPMVSRETSIWGRNGVSRLGTSLPSTQRQAWDSLLCPL